MRNVRYIICFIAVLAVFLIPCFVFSVFVKIYDHPLNIVFCFGVFSPLCVATAHVVANRVAKPRRTFFRAFLGGSGVFTVFLLFYSIFPMEGMFLFKPLIDTNFAEHYSRENFGRIGVGMSGGDVLTLVGEPLHVSAGEDGTVWHYSSDSACKWYDFAWYGQEVVFKEGLVTKTLEGWRYD